MPCASGCLPGASGGGASLVPVAVYLVPVAAYLVPVVAYLVPVVAYLVPVVAYLGPVVEVPPWFRWLPGSSPAYSQPDT